MAEMYQLDYGYYVQVLEGHDKGKKGYITMASRFGDVGVNTSDKPSYGYDCRVHPSKLEILSTDDTHGLRSKMCDSFSFFDMARTFIALTDPEFVLANKEHFPEKYVEWAERKLKDRTDEASPPGIV